MKIEVRDEAGSALPDGEVGEIFICSNCLFSGYFALPDLTAERLRDGWYRTGDIGCVSDGELFVTGRVDDLIIVNGRNIIAHEVESDLAKVPGLAPGRALVAGEFADVIGSSRLLVLAELTDHSIDRSSVERHIRATVLATCGISPALIELVPRGFLIKSTSGKLARRKSIEKYLQNRDRE
jgi:acyl-CoA synthetase (AMP-forming)/AMP-acid ligase II